MYNYRAAGKCHLVEKMATKTVPERDCSGRHTVRAEEGFQVPYGYWLQTSLKSLFFDSLAAFARKRPGILDVQYVEDLFARTCSGKQNHSPMLWKILNFLVWANRTDIDITEKA